MLGSIYQYPSFSEYFASLLLLFLSCLSVMSWFTRRSAANVADDDTRGSSFDPLLSLQSSTEMNVLSPSPEIQNPKDLSSASYDLLVWHI
jgi:hypothetical protein